jgi:hypothetical protein
MQNPIQTLQHNLAPYRAELLRHGIYQSIESLEDLQVFMQHHVFAVWDFMSLLKSLQKELTCVEVPWFPKGSPAVRRLINEIVLEEETDVDPHGNPASHFELYLRAMHECGADTQAITQFLGIIETGKSVFDALNMVPIPESVHEFVKHTFQLILEGKPHVIAAAFTFGREDVIPDMFRRLVADLNTRMPGALETFTYYLDRHIHLDEEVHTPLAMRMIAELCGDDVQKWEECEEAARGCIAARLKLWEGIRREVRG